MSIETPISLAPINLEKGLPQTTHENKDQISTWEGRTIKKVIPTSIEVDKYNTLKSGVGCINVAIILLIFGACFYFTTESDCNKKPEDCNNERLLHSRNVLVAAGAFGCCGIWVIISAGLQMIFNKITKK